MIIPLNMLSELQYIMIQYPIMDLIGKMIELGLMMVLTVVVTVIILKI